MRGKGVLHQNTPEHARVMSWWDYGYQIAGVCVCVWVGGGGGGGGDCS